MKKRSKAIFRKNKVLNNFKNPLSKFSSRFIKSKNISSEKAVLNKSEGINPKVAKVSFVVLMVLIFFSLTYFSPSITSLTTYPLIETINPSVNFVIFFGLIAFIFFITYEKKKSK